MVRVFAAMHSITSTTWYSDDPFPALVVADSYAEACWDVDLSPSQNNRRKHLCNISVLEHGTRHEGLCQLPLSAGAAGLCRPEQCLMLVASHIDDNGLGSPVAVTKFKFHSMSDD